MLVEDRPSQHAPSPDAPGWKQPRRRRAAAVAIMALLTVGVGVAARTARDPFEVLVVGSGGDTLLVDARDGTLVARVPGGVPSPDGTVVVASEQAGARTVVRAVDSATGAERWRRVLPAGQSARLVSGDTVVLGPDDGGDVYEPPPRARTTLTVSRPDGARSYRLEGNFEPEALSADGESLFVISYVPPVAPDHYQVRRLDLSSGEVVDVYTPDAHLQEEMRGTARVQAWAPDGSRLYTLYSLEDGDGFAAFVHVLALDDLWAHCVDLPEGMASNGEQTVSLAVAPDGDVLYAVDRSSGTLVEVDTARLAVTRTATLPRGDSPAASAVAGDGRLLMGGGDLVELRARDTLAVEQTWRLPGALVGLRVTAGGREGLAVLDNREVQAFDLATSELLRAFIVPGDGFLESVGGTAKGVGGPRDAFDCAC